MYKLSLALALAFPLITFSQDSISPAGQPDSSNYVSSYADSIQKEDIKRMSERSANYFANLLRERRVREKKQAILYIAMGVFFLAVLIVGLLRKRKKTQ